jgi:CarboxypepD_reg-like domain
MKRVVLSMLFVLQTFFVFAQQTTGITGKVVDAKTQKPLQNVVTSIQNTNLTQVTTADGKFTFTDVPKGNQLLKVKSEGYKEQLLPIEIVPGQMLDLGVVVLEIDVTSEQQLSLINITETELSDENSSSESTLGLLQSSRDVFLQAAAYNFGQARFSVRGIDNEYANVMINGVSMNKSSDGRPQYGDWGGLNDATRNQEFTNGSAPSDYVFGGIAGTQEINTRASIYRPGTRLSFLTTNTNYSYRAMATHASGMDKDGWGFVISGGRRWSEEAYFEGTNYSANSLFASVEKRFNEHHSLNFTSIYAQNKRGKNSPNTNEVTDLVGEKYNSYWGYQAGKKRNSRFKDAEEPLMMLTHYWKINNKTNLNTTVSYQTGRIGNSRLDYYKEDNPDPIYYKNLPSYYTSLHTFINNVSVFTPNAIAAESARVKFLANSQINWQNIYRVNNENLANGSRVVQYEDRNDENIVTINSNLTSSISDNLFMSAGVNYEDSRTKNFKNMLDLLGGSYFTDISTFGFGDQQQSDLNNPNRQVSVNDHYGYNYNIYAKRLNAFTQFKFTYDKVDFYLAQNFTQSSYQREGLYKNGYYPTNSFGKSEEKTFDNFGFKGGLTLKITGRHLLDFNALYMSKAPNSKDVFPNARVNNSITDNLTNEKIKSVDASYIIRAPKLKARFTGYYSELLNSTDINFYYTDVTQQFVAEIVTGINKKNKGVEAGIEYQLTSTIKVTGVAAYGEYTYTNNPNVKLTNDNTANVTDLGASQLKGYRQAGSPQQAYSVGIEYRDPKFWWIGVNGNYLADNYLDISTLTRTSKFSEPIDAATYPTIVYNQDKANEFLAQEKFNPIRLLNVVGGKSWRFAYKYTLGLFANVNNVLDYKYKTGGFEQSRSASYKDIYEDRQGGGVGPFGPRYFNGYGRTYTVNIYFTF